MSAADMRPWSLGDFFAWQERQEELYELVDGLPVRMTTCASKRHDQAIGNSLTALRSRLKGRPCRPFTTAAAIETISGQIRRADIGVECGAADHSFHLVAEPKVVFEMLSRPTRYFDRVIKLEEYRRLASLRHIVIVEVEELGVLHISRPDQESSWTTQFLQSREDEIALTAIGVMLPFTEIYHGILDVSVGETEANGGVHPPRSGAWPSSEMR
ncbi:MAG: Uma2 family endonuclease [Pseudomonadota bacterium]|nr:Uma2 family endonuclease [Pseudomonadota bacterium]